MNRKKQWFCQDCRVLMTLTDMDFYKCPECGIEVWFPEYNQEKEAKKIAEELSDVIIPVNRKGGGGNKSCGSSKKQLLKKKSTKMLYNELCK